MLKAYGRYYFGAIALYLALYYASGSGTLLNNGGNAAVNFTKALQGRG
jgi:hypothetical protein